jgi:hypothetical protein
MATGRPIPLSALGRDDHVGLDVVLLEGEPGAGAPAAGLHLVDDQGDAQLPRELPDPQHELLPGRDHAAFALHHLHDHGGGQLQAAVRVAQRALQEAHAVGLAGLRVEGERAAAARGEGEEAHAGHAVGDGSLLADVPGEGHRGVAAAVEPALERHDPAAAGRRLAQLDRRVHRVGPGRATELDLHPVRIVAGIDSWASVNASLAEEGMSGRG